MAISPLGFSPCRGRVHFTGSDGSARTATQTGRSFNDMFFSKKGLQMVRIIHKFLQILQEIWVGHIFDKNFNKDWKLWRLSKRHLVSNCHKLKIKKIQQVNLCDPPGKVAVTYRELQYHSITCIYKIKCVWLNLTHWLSKRFTCRIYKKFGCNWTSTYLQRTPI